MKRGDQLGDIFRPTAECRNFDGEDAQAKEQILSELALAHGLFQIGVRRRDDADIRLTEDGLRPGGGKLWSCRKRSSLVWQTRLSESTSSRNSVPPSASLWSPTRARAP